MDAYQTGQQVMVTDLAKASQRWPNFSAKALAAGYGAVFGFPLRLRDQRIGALNLLRHQPGHLGEVDVLAAQALADAAPAFFPGPQPTATRGGKSSGGRDVAASGRAPPRVNRHWDSSTTVAHGRLSPGSAAHVRLPTTMPPTMRIRLIPWTAVTGAPRNTTASPPVKIGRR